MSNKTENRSLKLYVVGGLHELGKNTFVFEVFNPDNPDDSDILILDAGLRYIGHEEPGIDYAIADYRFLKAKQDKIRALVFFLLELFFIKN